MKFVISSTDLLSHLQAISKVISPKNTLPILDNFLFKLEGNTLEITASDLETTMITSLTLENASAAGNIAIPAKLLNDILKEFPEQPLTFDINKDTLQIIIKSENGQFTIVGQDGNDYPQIPGLKDSGKMTLTLPVESLSKGLARSLFATSDDDLRPIMNGVLFEISKSSLTFVATDAQKLVKYERKDVTAKKESAFVLPKKPANLLKGVLPKEKGEVKIEFDDKNALFTLSGYILVCRLAEGSFPSYNAVIPTENPNKLRIDRNDFANALRRVSVFSNQASNLIRMQIKGNTLTISAQDIDFSISAYERLNCQYDGEDLEIGFKSTYLVEILSNISSGDVLVEMSNPSKAGIIKPAETDDENENVLMLLMPMMINA